MHPLTIIDWQDNTVIMLDQRKLPLEETYVTHHTHQEVAASIKNLTIRGAPAIGVAAAMGVAIGALNTGTTNETELKQEVWRICDVLLATRPTAVNLKWGLDCMKRAFETNQGQGIKHIRDALIAQAIKIKDEDIETNKKMGEHGQRLLDDGDTVLTHCNAGALATAGWGTAVGVVYAAIARGKKISVFADETRPVLQGARLTAWELCKHQVPVTVITDNMAAKLMGDGLIHKVIVGADRIAANGDTANKIGTYGVAIAARYHHIPFYVAAPFSTIDPKTPTGAQIPIEERHEEEVTTINGKRVCPEGVLVRNPAFDVTPAALITGIITERGIFEGTYGF